MTEIKGFLPAKASGLKSCSPRFRHVVVVGLIVTLTPLGNLFGFVFLPAGFYVFLITAVVAYLLSVEAAKRLYLLRARGGRFAC